MDATNDISDTDDIAKLNELSKLKKSLRRIVNNKTNITVEDFTNKLEIRTSPVRYVSDGLFVLEDSEHDIGVFATEFIPKDTVILDYNIPKHKHMIRKINDLAYNNTSIEYETYDNISANINLGYILQVDNNNVVYSTYLYALRDINKDEQLSKYYGVDYWQQHEFWSRHKYSNFTKTNDIQDLPTEYVFIDTIRWDINIRHNLSVFAKKIGNKYYYLVGNGTEYYKPGFFEFADFMDVTKDDHSLYEQDEIIYNGMKFTKYLKTIPKINMITMTDIIDTADLDKLKSIISGQTA